MCLFSGCKTRVPLGVFLPGCLARVYVVHSDELPQTVWLQVIVHNRPNKAFDDHSMAANGPLNVASIMLEVKSHK
jgi:hypothetical protein